MLFFLTKRFWFKFLSNSVFSKPFQMCINTWTAERFSANNLFGTLANVFSSASCFESFYMKINSTNDSSFKICFEKLFKTEISLLLWRFGVGINHHFEFSLVRQTNALNYSSRIRPIYDYPTYSCRFHVCACISLCRH